MTCTPRRARSSGVETRLPERARGVERELDTDAGMAQLETPAGLRQRVAERGGAGDGEVDLAGGSCAGEDAERDAQDREEPSHPVSARDLDDDLGRLDDADRL